jgi:flagellar motor switch protein FliM
MKSSEGDTFAMATPEHVLVKVAGERVFFADIGKVGPNAAISMKKRITMNGDRDG